MMYPQHYGPPQEHPQATMILVLGILGLVFCQVCAPFAWIMGKKARNEIDASGGAIGGRSSVNTGYILGIIGSVLLLLGFLVVVLWFVLLVVIGIGASTSNSY